MESLLLFVGVLDGERRLALLVGLTLEGSILECIIKVDTVEAALALRHHEKVTLKPRRRLVNNNQHRC
jgi:hypothetical protein